MNKKFLTYISLIGILVLIAGVLGCSEVSKSSPADAAKVLTAQKVRVLPTYFNYTFEEIESLHALDSNKEMTTDEVYKWEEKIYDLKTRDKIEDSYKALPYLVVAQRDAAYLSFNAHQKFKGSLDAVSKDVLCYFYPEICHELTADTDKYSELLSKIVLAKIKVAYDEEKQLRVISTQREGNQYWHSPSKIYVDPKLWLIDYIDQFKVAEPPEHDSPEDIRQFQAVRDTLKNVTNEQKKAIFKWSGGPGVKSSREHWLVELASRYMKNNNIDLEQTLMIRSILQLTVSDAYNVDTYWKYYYLVKRPFMRDPTILTVMPTPNSPSYPSVSTATAAAGNVIMSYYFPENKHEWDAYAQEMASSRIWSGIHFPMDIEEAVLLGEKVAKWVLDNKIVDSKQKE